MTNDIFNSTKFMMIIKENFKDLDYVRQKYLPTRVQLSSVITQLKYQMSLLSF